MALRLFGGRGSGKVRACPACERAIAVEATFCPSCYMVMRPEGAADLREHLQGGRIPADVYLLRKMQAEDPNTGPVVRVSRDASASPPAAEPCPTPPAAPSEPPAGKTSDLLFPSAPLPSHSAVPSQAAAETATAPPGQAESRARARTLTGVQALLEFAEPLPPPTRAVEETPVLFVWMLERDPVIPNNTELLEAIHASAFRDKVAARLGYAQHVLLQIADDLWLHPTQDSLDVHLTVLAAAYRRAAEAYRAAADRGEQEANAALWQMASIASRLRVEAWVYQTRHGVRTEVARPRRRPRSKKTSGH